MVRDIDLRRYWVFVDERSDVTIEDSAFYAIVANLELDAEQFGGPATIRNNTTQGIVFQGPALVEGNTLIASPDNEPGTFGSGIVSGQGDGRVIRDNRVEGFRGTAIRDNQILPGQVLQRDGIGTISGNLLVDNDGAISARDETVVQGNTVTGGTTGIIVTGGSPELLENEVSGVTGQGLRLAETPLLQGNTSCGNRQNIWIAEDADPSIDDSNEICEDVATVE
jgi:hypothetical protein